MLARAFAISWQLRWLAVAIVALFGTATTAGGASPARLVPVVATAFEVQALGAEDIADTAGPTRSDRVHGLGSTDTETERDVEVDVAELEEEDERERDERDERRLSFFAGDASPAKALLAASRDAEGARGVEIAAAPSWFVLGPCSPRGPPARA